MNNDTTVVKESADVDAVPQHIPIHFSTDMFAVCNIPIRKIEFARPPFSDVKNTNNEPARN